MHHDGMSTATPQTAAARFTVTYTATAGSYSDRIGRYGVTDARNPHMGNFYSGMSKATASRIARELNAR